MKTRDQSIFDEMYKRISQLGFTVYDYKPMDDVPYPFVEFEDTTTSFKTNKTDIKGDIELVLSVWGLQKKRKQTSDMASAIFTQAMAINETSGYRLMFKPNQSNISLFDDNTTTIPLKRARVRLVFTLL